MITHGLARSAPKALPARATPTPRAEYMTPMPRTYMEAKRKARTRDTASSLAPKIPTTMGIMGYTQGVRDVRNPATKTLRYAHSQPLERAASNSDGAAWARAGTRRITAPTRAIRFHAARGLMFMACNTTSL